MDTFLHVLAVIGNGLFLIIAGAVLLLHWISLPANWILLGLGVVYALITGFDPVGLWTLIIMAALAGVAEALEFFVGVGYTAKRGATRWGVVGAFFGGILGAVAGTSVVPPFGTLLGAFLGSFAGAVVLEYISQERVEQALQSGKAAFVGKVFGALAKTMCGVWMWLVLAYQILVR